MKQRFESIAKEYEKSLYAQAVKRLMDPMDAQDAVQETFLKAWLHFEKLSECDYIGPWLMRVLINECISMQRRRQSRQRLYDAAMRAGWHENAFDDGLVSRIDIDRALTQIDESKQALLKYYWFGGCSIAKIAQLTGHSRPAVYAQIDRGRRKLRQMIG